MPERVSAPDTTINPDPRDVVRQYRKRPVVISAIRYTGTWDNTRAILRWSSQGISEGVQRPIDVIDNVLVIHTLEGDMQGPVGWWIIKGLAGEFYACESSIFEQSYELAD